MVLIVVVLLTTFDLVVPGMYYLSGILRFLNPVVRINTILPMVNATAKSKDKRMGEKEDGQRCFMFSIQVETCLSMQMQ